MQCVILILDRPVRGEFGSKPVLDLSCSRLKSRRRNDPRQMYHSIKPTMFNGTAIIQIIYLYDQ